MRFPSHTRRMVGILMLSVGVAAAACAPAAVTSCDPAKIGFTKSTMGVNYARYKSPLREILSQGEQERLSTVQPYASMAPKIRRAVKKEWRDTLKELFAGTLSPTFTGGDEPDFDFLRAAAPQMLKRLKACGPAVDKRLAYLDGITLESPPASGGSE